MAQYDFSDFEDEKPVDPMAAALASSPMSRRVTEYIRDITRPLTPEGIKEQLEEGQKKNKQYLEDIKSVSKNPFSQDVSDAKDRLTQDSLNVAMGVAQPIGLKGSALAMDEASRMARAKKMGFDPETTYYHGTNEPINEFKAGHSVVNPEIPGFFTRDSALASEYSDKYPTGQNVLPVHLKMENTFNPSNPEHVDKVVELAKQKKIFSDKLGPERYVALKSQLLNNPKLMPERFSFLNSPDNWHIIEDPKITGLIRELGFDSAKIGERGKESFFVLNPKNIRSKFAEFDPKKSDSSNLSAGVAGAGLLGASALTANESQAGDKMPQYDFSDFDDKPAAGPKPASQYDFSDFEEKPKMSEMESAVRGGIQGLPAVGPWADEAQGAAEALWEKAKGDPKEFGELYKQHRDAARGKYKEAEATNPKSYLGGMAVPVAAMAIPKAIPVLGTAASGALGAVEGAGASEASDPEQIAKDAALMGGISAGTAGLGKLAMPAISKGLKYAGGKLGGAAEGLAARALGAERGTIKKLGAENVKDIGRYGLDQKIVTPLATAEEMDRRNAIIQKLSGKRMEDVYSKIDEAGASKFMPMDVAEQVSNELSPRFRTPINKSEWKQLDATLESIQSRGGDPIPLGEAQKLKEEIGSVAYPMGKRAMEPSPKQQMAMDAYTIINEAIDKATEEGAKTIGSKELSKELAEAKKLFGRSKDADKLLENRIAREAGNKMFGLTDSIAAAGGMGAGALGGAESSALTAAGMVAAKKAAEKFGPATGAVALDKVSQLLNNAPDKLGKYGPILQKAALRGEAALNTTHQMLMKDPQYQKLIGSE